MHKVRGFSLRAKINNASDLTDALLNHEEFVHLPHGHSVFLLLQLAAILETFQEDVFLRGSLLSQHGLDHLHDDLSVVMHSRVLSLLEGIVHAFKRLGIFCHLLDTLRRLELLSERVARLNGLFDDLVDAQVKHVVFDGQVAAHSIDINTLVVIHKQNLG